MLHMELILWNVFGLYAALAAEISVRFLAPTLFFWVVGLSGGFISTYGYFFIKKENKNIELKPKNL